MMSSVKENEPIKFCNPIALIQLFFSHDLIAIFFKPGDEEKSEI